MSTQTVPTQQEGGYKISPYDVGQRTIKEIIADLSRPIPERLLKTRLQGGAEIKYIPWHTAVKMLDYRAPGWTSEITHMIHLPGRTAMSIRITIPASAGQDAEGNNVVHYYHRDASGTEKDDVDNYGDPVSNAESMAFRRGCAKFGLGLGLYGGQGAGQSSSGQQSSGQGQSSAGITPKQLAIARNLAGERNLDENSISRNLYKKDLVDCSITEAKGVIEKLKSIPIKAATQQGGYEDESVF
jgi:hypothetical protein